MNANDMQAIETGGEPQAEPAGTGRDDLHETLLEGVSTDAMVARGFGEPDTATPSDPEAQAPEGEPAPLADDLTVVPEEEAEPVPFATGIVEAAAAPLAVVSETVAPETNAETVSETVAEATTAGNRLASLGPVALPDLRAVLDLAASPRIAQAMGELGEVNATVLTYLRGEGTAALAHWRALSGARNPAEAIRIQVDEMQRAADASLSCFAALARRAGRFTSVMGHR